MEHEKGKWYLGKACDTLFVARFDQIKSIHKSHYFYFSELYFQDGKDAGDWVYISASCIQGLATPAQIEQCLKAYAEKNGYVGAKIEIHNNIFEITNNFKYCDETDRLLFFNGWLHICVYEKGKWAEIVKEPETILTKTEGFASIEAREPIDSDLVILSPYIEPQRNVKLFDVPINIGNGNIVTIRQMIEVYQQHLDNKTIIG